MNNEERVYKLIQEYYQGEKSDILEIGAKTCSLINFFIVNGYENPVALDKNYMSPELCFLTYKIQKNDISRIESENSFLFKDLSSKKISIQRNNEITQTIRVDYKEEFANYKLVYYNNFVNTKDFFDYSSDKKFNVILCSFVLHYCSPEKDEEIFSKLKDFLSSNGIIYIKIHNLKKLNNIENGDKIVGNTIVGNNKIIQYPFDKKRIELYKKTFNYNKEITTSDVTELILKNNNG